MIVSTDRAVKTSIIARRRPIHIKYRHLIAGWLGIVCLLGLTGMLSYLLLASMIVLLIGTTLLWRTSESPILLFIFAYQWLQASMRVFHANWLGVELSQLSTYDGNVELATILSLIGLTVVAFGMRIGAASHAKMKEIAGQASNFSHVYSLRGCFYLYCCAWVASCLSQSLAWVIPGLTQLLLGVTVIKWASYWLLTYATFKQSNSIRFYWAFAFGLELVTGLGGFFSDFKTVCFFSLFALLASSVRVTLSRIVGATTVFCLLLSLSIVWTAIKKDYRAVVSDGESGQVVRLDFNDRITMLSRLTAQLDANELSEAVESLLERISYVEFFGVVLDTVPDTIPHTNGGIWWDAVSRPFTPRLLFPEKTFVDDSERTNMYTGLEVAGADRATSMSIGYMGESYIDFGQKGMMLPLFVFGLLLGWINRYLIYSAGSDRPMGIAFATATLYFAAWLESSITKTFGGLVLSALVAWLFLKFVAPSIKLTIGTKRGQYPTKLPIPGWQRSAR